MTSSPIWSPARLLWSPRRSCSLRSGATPPSVCSREPGVLPRAARRLAGALARCADSKGPPVALWKQRVGIENRESIPEEADLALQVEQDHRIVGGDRLRPSVAAAEPEEIDRSLSERWEQCDFDRVGGQTFTYSEVWPDRVADSCPAHESQAVPESPQAINRDEADRAFSARFRPTSA
jgi:hypothetical protein